MTPPLKTETGGRSKMAPLHAFLPSIYEDERSYAERIANTFLGTHEVKVIQTKYELAWANLVNKQIGLGLSQIFDDKNDPLTNALVFKGLLFHEIHHLLLTKTIPVSRHCNNEIKAALNILEDGRIETMAVEKHEKIADYLIAAVNQHIIKEIAPQNDTLALATAYLLLYGRKSFLPAHDIIAKVRAALVSIEGEEWVKSIEDISDTYIAEKRSNRRYDLAVDLAKILSTQGSSLPQSMSQGQWFAQDGVSADADAAKHDQPDNGPSKDTLKAQERAKNDIRQQSQGESQGQAKNKLQATKAALDKARAELDQVQQKVNTTTDTSTLKGLLKERDYASMRLDAAIRAYKREINLVIEETNKNITGQLGQIQAALTEKNEADAIQTMNDIGAYGSFAGLIDGGSPALTYDANYPITTEMQHNAEAVKRAVRRMNTNLKRGYQAGERTGRLNIRRYLNRTNKADTKVFSRYVPNRERGTKLLVNLYLDASGSMDKNGRWSRALAATWTLNEALMQDDNKVMVMVFGGVEPSEDIPKKYNETLKVPAFKHYQTTYIAKTLQKGAFLAERFRKANHYGKPVDIILTDGKFSDDYKLRDIIGKLRASGHFVAIITIDAKYPNQNLIGENETIDIPDGGDITAPLINLFERIKRGAVRGALRGKK